MIVSYKIKIKGLVQGVGFRPFIYRLALSHEIKGWVKNTTEQVIIRAEGEKINLENFIKNIKLKAPVAADIDSVDVEETNVERFGRQPFRISAVSTFHLWHL